MGFDPLGKPPNEFWDSRTEAAQNDLCVVLGIESKHVFSN